MKIKLKCVCNWDIVFKPPPTSLFFKWNLTTKGRTASELEVAGPQHKKVWEALVYRPAVLNLWYAAIYLVVRKQDLTFTLF